MGWRCTVPASYGRSKPSRPSPLPRHSLRSETVRDDGQSDPDAATIGSRLRSVPHVARLADGPAPAGEFQHDAVRVLEVERPHEYARVELAGDPELTVVVVKDRADPNALGLQLGAVLEEFFFGHVERDVVHRADRAGPLPNAGQRDRSGHTGNRIGVVREPEERQRVASAHVEKEMLAGAGRQVDRLDETHAEHLGVELDRDLHVGAHQRQVVDAPEVEFLVPPLHTDLPRLAPAVEPNLSSSSLSRQSSSGRSEAMTEIVREFIGLPSPVVGRAGAGGHPCQGIYHRPAGGQQPPTAFIATHYNVDFSEHYLAGYLADRGFGFLGWNTRFRGDEAHFLLDHALAEIGVGVRWLREQ